MRPLQTFGCLLGAIAALGLAVTTHVGESMIGFPDGHVTDYGKAVKAPLQFLAWAEAGLVCLFLVLAVAPTGTRVRGFGLLVAVVAVVGSAVVARVGIPWYFGVHLGLDDGIGG
jgi:hypothetical protein